METKISELEKLEDLILGYKSEKDPRKRHVLYIDLIQETMKLVNKIVAGFYPLPSLISKDDLVQVGALGVLKAIETYSKNEKGSFKTYVSKFIKGKIMHYLRDKANMVKSPRETSANINKIKEAIEELSDSDSRIPSVKQVANYVKMSESKVSAIMNIELIQNMVSLDQNVYSVDGTETLIDRIQSDEDETFQQTYENKKMIEYALSKLSEPDKSVIYDYYFESIPRKEIASRLNVSSTQVSRIIKRALHRMYNVINDEMNKV